MKKHITQIFFFFISVLVFGQNLTSSSTGSFIYTPVGSLNNKPMEVFYRIPNGDITTMPIIMSFHGANRNASDYRDYWISMANANGFMVFAPEFSDSNYPGGDSYQLANIFDDGDNPSSGTFNNQNEWTFSIIDALFEYIKTDISGTQQTYNAWGHSGGAQFLHRFVMYMPHSQLDIAVCSNSGWYTVPENTISFPYGILNGQLPNENLTSAFAKKVIIHLGQSDTDSNSAGLRHNTVVDNQQGLFRLERGKYFFNTSQSTSQTMSVFFNWEKHEVAGIGHEAQLMANDALQYILMSTLHTDNPIEKSIKVYPNPISVGFVNITNPTEKVLDLFLYNLLGEKLIKEKVLNDKLNISNLNSGVYILKIISENHTSTKRLVIK